MMLSQLRETKNLTQRDLAGIIGVAPSTIAMYEVGARTPSLGKARNIASYFGVSLDDIVFSAYTHERY